MTGMKQEVSDGVVLVASPRLMDPNFFRSVVLICRHSPEEGSMGLVLNRPTEVQAGKVLSQVEAARERHEPLWLGGPVDGRCLWILHRRGDLPDPGHEVLEGVYFTGEARVVERVLATNGGDPAGLDFRLFVGYAGWDAGQLDHEVEEGSWAVVPAGAGAVFTDAPGSMWREMSVRAMIPGLAAEDIRRAWLN